MSFRDNLQYLRSQRGMTQEQLAMLLGVSRQSISKWESEKAYPEMDKLLVICDLFGCTLDDLVLGDVRRPGMTASAGISQASEHPLRAGTRDAAGSNSSAGDPTTSDPAAGGGPSAAVAGDYAAATQIRSQTGTSALRSMQGTAPTGGSMPKDVTGYDVHMNRFAWRISLGVAAIIASVAVGILFSGEGIEGTGTAVGTLFSDVGDAGSNPVGDFLVFLSIAIGVITGLAFLIPTGIEHGQFVKRHPYVEDFYTESDRSQGAKELALGLVLGIAAILVGVSFVIFGSKLAGYDGGWPVSLLLLGVALGVWSFIFTGIRFSRLDVNQYNKTSETEREQAQHEEDFYGRLKGSISGIIMLLATIVGIVLLFTGNHFGVWAGSYFWLAWPIGGILCGIVSMIIDMVRDHHQARETR